MELGLRWRLLKVLTISSWRSRYRNSILGFAWGVLEPLSITFVFVLVFSVLTRGIYQGTVPYPVFVLLGTTLWTLFAQGTMQGGNGVLLRVSLVNKIYFPREYISLSYIITILVTASINLAVFTVLFALYGLSPTPAALLFPLIVGIELLLIVGISLLLAALFVRLEDLRYFWQLIIVLGLFASPVIYEAAIVPPHLAFWYNLNPMVGVLTAAREVLLYGTLPDMMYLAYPAFLGAALLGLGLFSFRRSEHLFAERL